MPTNSEQIEYYLGKTKHKNLFFKGQIPPAWEFPSYHINLQEAVNTRINPVKQDVYYDINNLGYNSKFDYTDKLEHNILCLGDSNTFGLLLRREQCWVGKLQEMMPNSTVWNLGLPGGSPDTVSRVGVNVVNALGNKVDAVAVVWPMYSRREVASLKFNSLVYKTPQDVQKIPYPEYWDFIDWRANSYNFYKNKLLLSSICEANNIPYYDLELDDSFKLHEEDVVSSYGKPEINSYGFDTHKAISMHFYKKINNMQTLFEERCRSS